MQLFRKSLNNLPLLAAVGSALGSLGIVAGFWYYASPRHLQVGYAPVQPVPYSHRLHAGSMGIDCRYCHANVERAAHAQIPASEVCMGCHATVKPESARLAPVRASWAGAESLEWTKVYRLPEHTYFDHSAHLAVGVGCVTCHGRVDQMDVVRLDQPIAMQWCLECHRNPAPALRPQDQVTSMTWTPSETPPGWTAPAVTPPKHCSGCHR
jgi:hypothetical protein